MSTATQTDSKKIILWDLHEVLFSHSLLHWIYLCLTYKHKWAVLCSLDGHILSLFFRYFLHVMHIKRAEITTQEIIDYARAKKAYALIDFIALVGSDYKPIPKTVAILHALQKKGYTQHVGSNIGTVVLDRFEHRFPDIFACFSDIYIVHYEDGVLIKKPNPQFFKSYLKKHNLTPDNVLFIDDKSYNVASAESCGIQSILYKNSAQLRRTLIKNNYL